MNLTDLGLSAFEERTYRHLLAAEPADAGGIAVSLGEPESVVTAALHRLFVLGLAALDEAGVVTATDPSDTLEQLADRRLAEVLNSFQQVAAARSSLPELLADLGAPGPTWERIDGIERTTSRLIEELRVRPPAEVRTVKTAGAVVRTRTNPTYSTTMFGLRSGMRFRTLVHESMLDIPESVAYYQGLGQAGYQVRYVGASLQTMAVLDDTRAFVPIELTSNNLGALLIRHAGTVATLVSLFDAIWTGTAERTAPANNEASDADRALLAALQATAKDELAARQLDVSVRSLRRQIASLMNRLGAENRFQLAAIAKDRGWL